MAAVVECGCGERLEAETEVALRAEIDGHVVSAHPDLVGTLSPLELAGRPDRSGAEGVQTADRLRGGT